MLSDAARFLRTVWYLRAGQLVHRVLFHLRRPRPETAAAPPQRKTARAYLEPICRAPSLLGPTRFKLLGREDSLPERGGWDDPALAKLWRYNLHYFDDLNADGAAVRETWHQALIERWVRENPPAAGTGWEPFPTSLRIANWVKWSARGRRLSQAAELSLAVQARWLAKRLELHLLGNHLLANAKALVHAGAYFEGPEASTWLRKGMQLWDQQLTEQILSDGGHFERSPMYHALVLEDLLDTINILGCYGLPESEACARQVEPMLRWLATMTHPDGAIGFFNDAAFGIAAEFQALAEYASRSGFGTVGPAPTAGCVALEASGYLRLARGDAVALLDCAPIGPDYLPGHAHADTLSFELSVFGHRLVVNSGTSQYGVDAERQRQRGTAAHSTVAIDDADSSEVWAGFRVARRARPGPVTLDEREGDARVACSHDGYLRLPGRNLHSRRWTLGARRFTVEDGITGVCRRAVARFYLHPAVMVEDAHGAGFRLRGPDGRTVAVEVNGADRAYVRDATWHPEFGAAIPNRCLVVELGADGLRTEFSW